MLAATINYESPLFWALLIGWIMSVTIHEFAHGLIAHFGGDYTIQERGGLTLNPLQYVDPIFSIALPAIFLLMGGVPLPGGVTYVRRDLLKNKWWDSGVSLAGPASNFILFLACALPLHPAVGWVNTSHAIDDVPQAQVFLAAMATLQFIAVLLNLIPIPPLDGFGVIGPHMNPETRLKMMTPPLSTMLFIGLFVLIMSSGLVNRMFQVMIQLLGHLGFNDDHQDFFRRAFNYCLFGMAS
jgi:Zn-dependent protease